MKKLFICCLITQIQAAVPLTCEVPLHQATSLETLLIDIDALAQKTCTISQPSALAPLGPLRDCHNVLCALNKGTVIASMQYRLAYCIEQDLPPDYTPLSAATVPLKECTIQGTLIRAPQISRYEYDLLQKTSRAQQAEIMRKNYALERWEP